MLLCRKDATELFYTCSESAYWKAARGEVVATGEDGGASAPAKPCPYIMFREHVAESLRKPPGWDWRHPNKRQRPSPGGGAASEGNAQEAAGPGKGIEAVHARGGGAGQQQGARPCTHRSQRIGSVCGVICV
jgi:hypothetical protein